MVPSCSLDATGVKKLDAARAVFLETDSERERQRGREMRGRETGRERQRGKEGGRERKRIREGLPNAHEQPIAVNLQVHMVAFGYTETRASQSSLNCVL